MHVHQPLVKPVEILHYHVKILWSKLHNCMAVSTSSQILLYTN